jgi:hypothetical protein
MMSLVRRALNPAAHPSFKQQDILVVSQTSEPVQIRVPVITPAAPAVPAQPEGT